MAGWNGSWNKSLVDAAHSMREYEEYMQFKIDNLQEEVARRSAKVDELEAGMSKLSDSAAQDRRTISELRATLDCFESGFMRDMPRSAMGYDDILRDLFRRLKEQTEETLRRRKEVEKKDAIIYSLNNAMASHLSSIADLEAMVARLDKESERKDTKISDLKLWISVLRDRVDELNTMMLR